MKRGSFILGEIGDFSQNTALQVLRLEGNELTGEFIALPTWFAAASPRFIDSFILGEIGDFSKNDNLTHLYLFTNKFTGNVNLDGHQS